jgi:hypothetical protein
MQDRTIDNALLALQRSGGEQAELARAILALRGVPLPRHIHDRPLVGGKCKHLMLAALSAGPMTTLEATAWVKEAVPGISHTSAYQRAYLAVRRLEEAGKVRREGRVWRLATV